MSRIDPGLLNYPIPPLTPQPTPLQRQQMQVSLEDQKQQALERQATVAKMRQDAFDRFTKQNELRAVQGMIGQKKAANQEITPEDFLAVAPMNGADLSKAYFLDQKQQLENQASLRTAAAAVSQAHKDFLTEVGTLASSLRKQNAADRGQDLQSAVQAMLQPGGAIDTYAKATKQDPTTIANAFLQHDLSDAGLQEDIDTAPNAIALHEEQRKQALNDADIAQKNAAAAKDNAEAAKPPIVPEGGTALDKNGRPLFTSPPKPTDFDKEVKAWVGSAQSKGYPQNEAGYRDYLTKKSHDAGVDAALARAKAEAGNDPRLANVPPNLHKDVLDKVQKVQDDYTTAQQAADDMQSFIDAMRSGNKQASAYIDTEGVLTLNTGRGVKRVNQAEIASYEGAGSIYDRVVGALKKGTTGVGKSDSVINDIEQLHQTIINNATGARDRKLKSIDATYRSGFAPTGTSAGPRAGIVIDPAGGEHHVKDVDAAIRLHPGTKEKK